MALAYLAVLALSGWLMISRRLTATLALPLTALAITLLALASGLPQTGLAGALQVLINDVVETGLKHLINAILAVILGAVLAAQMKLSGAAERIVRYAAEYAGEDRFKLGLILLTAAALLFTTLGGLGAVILVASVMLPILLSLGFEPRVAAGLMLLALSLGGCLNPVNWALYKDVLGLPPAQIIPYALTLAGIYLAVCIAFLLRQTSAGQPPLRQSTPLAVLLLAAGGLTTLVLRFPPVWTALKQGLSWLLAGLLVLLCLLLLWRLIALVGQASSPAGGTALMPSATSPESTGSDSRAYARRSRTEVSGSVADAMNRVPTAVPDNWLAAAAIFVPLLLLLWGGLQANLHPDTALAIPINTALLCGIVFALLASHSADGGSGNRLMRALHEGVVSAAPAVILLLGIGMLLKATALPEVQAAFAPLIARLPIQTPLGFVLTFFLLSPLALYRGPLNLYGMGSGIVGILSGAALVGNGLLMTAFFAVGMLQGVCDPTNTHNVWIANFCRVPVNELTRLLFPWVLVIVLAGLAAGAAMFASSFQPGWGR